MVTKTKISVAINDSFVLPKTRLLHFKTGIAVKDQPRDGARPRMNGADLLCQSLFARGIRCAFGLPGTQTIPLYEAVRRSALRSVVTTHELAGAFMANGYY